MLNKVLKIEYEYDFELVGIVSNAPNYKLCWKLNSIFNWRLEKIENLKIPQTKSKYKPTDIPQLFEKESSIESIHSLYVYKKEDIDFLIIENKNNGLLLLPEAPQISHFLMIQGYIENKELLDIIEKINQIYFINTAFSINFKEFANKQNLIFEYDKPKQNKNSSYVRASLLKSRSAKTND